MLNKLALTLSIYLCSSLALASQTDVYFSPNGGAADAIIAEVNLAKTSILVMTYQATHVGIIDSLIRAKERGVTVNVIVDRSQHRSEVNTKVYCCASGLATKVNTLVDYKHKIQHNKVMVIDDKTVITGSFNFSASAEKHNAENLLVLHDVKELAAKYTKNYQLHSTHSEKF